MVIGDGGIKKFNIYGIIIDTIITIIIIINIKATIIMDTGITINTKEKDIMIITTDIGIIMDTSTSMATNMNIGVNTNTSINISMSIGDIITTSTSIIINIKKSGAGVMDGVMDGAMVDSSSVIWLFLFLVQKNVSRKSGLVTEVQLTL